MLALSVGAPAVFLAAAAAAWPLPQQVSTQASSQVSPSAKAPVNASDGIAAATAASNLKDDERLHGRLTVHARRISVDALMDSISRQTGVSISLHRFYQGHNLTVFVQSRTAAEIMAGVAELLRGEWIAAPNGYQLRPAQATLLYQRTWWDLLNAERDKALLTTEQSYVDLMNDEDSSKPTALYQKKTALERMRDKTDRSPGPFWENLPSTVKRDIARSFNDGYTYRRFPMPSPGSSEGGVVLPIDRLPDECKASLKYSFESLNETLSSDSIRAIAFVSSGPNFYADALLKDGRRTAVGSTLVNDNVAKNTNFSVDHRFIKDPAPGSGIRLSRTWERMLAFQHKTVWNNGVPPETIPEASPPRLPDVLEWMSSQTRQAGVGDYIADDYQMPSRLMTKAERGQKPSPDAKNELNQIATTYDVSWKESAQESAPRLMLVAHNRWYRENLLDPPQNLVDRLADNIRAIQAPPQLDKKTGQLYEHLTAASFVVAGFTKWQIANGLCFFVDEDRLPAPERQSDAQVVAKSNCQPYADICATCLIYPATCNFFGLLSPADRVALLTDGLPVSQLGAPQRDAAAQIGPELAAAVYADNVMDKSSDVRIEIMFTTVSLRIHTGLLFGNSNEGYPPYQMRFTVMAR